MHSNSSHLVHLQRHQDRIRNMCILAHVDHGKTTLSDHLIASNGLIHPRLVGELRYLDFKEDEQLRGITMKSSSITLLYNPQGQSKDSSSSYLINLIDSPGHVDFCSEVSTATRLSDGGLVVVDAVEGVCIQTHAVLRQAWEEKVKPCLMVNKMDRLIVELCMTPVEAYQRLQQIVTHVNMIWSAFESEKFISEADAILAHEDAKESAEGTIAEGEELEDVDNEADAFQPSLGNVAFGSAMDGWAFRVDQFAAMYAEKLGAKADALQKALWGDFHFSPKEKKVVRIRQKGGVHKMKPMFVQFALEPLWKAYSACQGEDQVTVLGPIVKGRGLNVPDKVLSSPDPKQAVKAVLKAWLPLSEAVLHMAVHHLPSPQEAAAHRVPRLLGSFLPAKSQASSDSTSVALTRTVSALKQAAADDSAPVVVYVSKMIAVPVSQLPRQPNEPAPTNPHEECFLAFGRVFSGVVKQGQRLHVLSALYDPKRPQQQRQSVVVKRLYLMMGRALEQLQEVPAGNILAISGLETAILKSATLASTPCCPPLAPMIFQAAPIVKVALEPVLPSDMGALMEGLRLLNRADPFVEVSISDRGEHVLGAAGEVHLETCIKDLKERFARIQIQVSQPLVAFRETVCHPDEVPEGTTCKGARVVEAVTPNGACTVRVKAHPLPARVASLLDEHEDTLQHLRQGEGGGKGEGGGGEEEGPVQQLREQLVERLKAQPKALALVKNAWMLGPKHVGPNLLLVPPPASTTAPTPPSSSSPSLFSTPSSQVVVVGRQQVGNASSTAVPGAHAPTSASTSTSMDNGCAASEASPSTLLQRPVFLHEPLLARQLGLHPASPSPPPAASPEEELVCGSIRSGVVAGFQLAAATGPLCDEPLWGVALEVELRLNLTAAAAASTSAGGAEGEGEGWGVELAEEVYGPFSGQVMTTVASACRRAVLEGDPRLVEAQYLCSIQTSSEALSGVYAVLGRRRARILREDMKEGSDAFMVHSYLPVEASFGLTEDLRRRCSGAASASLLLSHWERLQVDPFFVATTEDEREEHGEDAVQLGNLAKKHIDMVRRRKGLPVEEKKVEKATKQRTLKRNV